MGDGHRARAPTLRMLQFRGRGIVALALGEAPIAIKVTEDRPTLLAGARLVGWVGRLVPHGAPVVGGSDADAAPFQVVCQGEGVVLLDTPTGVAAVAVRTCAASSPTSPTWSRWAGWC